MAIIHPVGELQDECEKKVVRYLAKNLPDSFHIYHNLELIQYRRGHPYEYDLVVVGKSSVWAIEVKGYRGFISGNASKWYFDNGHPAVDSPIPLINMKARVLKNNIEKFAPRLKGAPFYVDSLVVLCFNETRFRINDPQHDRVCRLFELPARIMGTDDSKDKAHPIHQFQEAVCKALDERFGPLTPEKIIGDYELEESMSGLNTETRVATYPARHRLLTSTGRVMLKVYYLDIRLSEKELEKQKTQILREAEALNLLGAHPNIVRCYAPFLFDEDKIVIPFEWVEGIPLREVLDNRPFWTIPDRLARFLQVCAGLAHAHRNGIVHRGISSENVLCVEGDRIKLVGFKLAKILSSASTSKGMTRYLSGGKPNYMAPELFLDVHAATPKSDMYSLGVLFYELVTGENTSIPDTGLSERQINRLQAASGDVYPALAQVIERMCAPAIGLRYNSVDEIVEALQSLL